VILALDEVVAAEVLRNIPDSELVVLAGAVDELDPIPAERLGEVLEEFERRMRAPVMPGAGGEYIRRLASSALGPERASRLFTAASGKAGAMDLLRQVRADILAGLLQEEHPQVAAVILSQLPPGQAARVLGAMRPELQADLVARVAALEELPARVLDLVSEALVQALREAGALTDAEGGATSEFDGLAFAAALLNEMGNDEVNRLLDDVGQRAGDLASGIREAMFTFEDLGRLDTRALQLLMREIQSEQLLLALRSASDALREKFFASVSQRAALTMREDLLLMPPRRLSEVERAQREIVEAAMRLATEGQIVLPGVGAEEMV
jgi:flagellar motor switch protein FliG